METLRRASQAGQSAVRWGVGRLQLLAMVLVLQVCAALLILVLLVALGFSWRAQRRPDDA